MPTEHFKSKKAYAKWNAYRHIHGVPAPNLKTAVVAGKAHKVKHGSLNKLKKLGMRKGATHKRGKKKAAKRG